MRLDSITFQNWQPFLGRGFDGTTFALRSNTGLKNMIIYAENSHGKSAIWQAIQFALYGKVNKRKTGWQEGKFKPYIGKSTAEEPLLNQTAKENGDYTFGIILDFNHKGDDYTLERMVSTRKGVKVPRSNSDMQEEGLYIKNESAGNRIKEPQNFINEILPYDLAQFFMFDGERLNEYRLLFEDTNDVKLKGFIEDILRFPVLTDGTQDFKDLKKKAKKAVRTYDLRSNSDKDLNTQVKKLQTKLDGTEETKLKTIEEKSKYEGRLGVVNSFLEDNDKGAAALVQQTIYETKVKELEDEINDIQKRIGKELLGKWRTLLSSRVEKRLDEYGSELKRQENEVERIGVLKGQIESLEGRLKGEACKTCGHVHNKPNLKEKDGINQEIISLENELKILKKTSIAPDRHTLYNKQRALQGMSSSSKLDTLITLEEDIVKKKQEKRTAGKNLVKAQKLLTAEARREVQEYIAEANSLRENIGVLKADIQLQNEDINEFEKYISLLMEKIQPETETIAHKKARTKVNILSALIRVWENVTETHSETMRAIVEKNASEMFMSLTNKKKTYSGLRIHSDFQVEIIHRKKTRDAEAGSGGQSALMAYSILDALTKSSGIEFPMIVDTPATSIDSKNLKRLFDYLFNESGKQVILLPESKELHPDIGDERYGPTCASTYQLQLIGEYEDLTVRNIRVNNTEIPSEELSHD